MSSSAPIRAAAAAAILLCLPSCVAVPETVYSPCHASGSGGWTAAVEPQRAADGRVLDRYDLVVSGEVTVPSGGYRVYLDKGPVQKVEPRSQQVLVRTEPPEDGATMALVTHRVRTAFAAPKRVGRVVIRCGDGILAVLPVSPPARR